MTLVEEIDDWVQALNARYRDKRHSCEDFAGVLSGFYSRAFLQNAGFVVVDQLPLPDSPQLRASGVLTSLTSHDIVGITFDDTYYVLRGHEHEVQLHFHELVHVAQWRALGRLGFIARYLQELSRYGYSRQAPLEKMAYDAQEHYANGEAAFDVVQNVQSLLSG